MIPFKIQHFISGCKWKKVHTGLIEIHEKKNNNGIILGGIWDVYECEECEKQTATQIREEARNSLREDSKIRKTFLSNKVQNK